MRVMSHVMFRTVCGTSEYMAPEIIREGRIHKAGLGLGEGYDKKVDWWAFGILVFEMANVGEKPLSMTMHLYYDADYRSIDHHFVTKTRMTFTP